MARRAVGVVNMFSTPCFESTRSCSSGSKPPLRTYTNWRYGARQYVYVRKGGFDPEEQLRVLSKHGVENMFTTPTALRAMTAVSDAGKRYPLDRLRITCSA